MSQGPICVVDDDSSMREGLQGLLRSAGHTVETFESADAFLEGGAIHRAACLLLDVCMPGTTGPRLQERLVAQGSAVPIVFMTARHDEHIERRVLGLGARAFLLKPLDHDVLLDLLEPFLATPL